MNMISLWVKHVHEDIFKPAPCLVCKEPPGIVHHNRNLECLFKSESLQRDTLSLLWDPNFEKEVLPMNGDEKSTTVSNISDFYLRLIKDVNFKIENGLLEKAP